MKTAGQCNRKEIRAALIKRLTIYIRRIFLHVSFLSQLIGKKYRDES